jgi:transposase
VHLILDNYGTHKTQLIRDWMLKRPRFHLHFAPTSFRWLNLVEHWFAMLTEKQRWRCRGYFIEGVLVWCNGGLRFRRES